LTCSLLAPAVTDAVSVSDILLRRTMPAQAIYDEQHRCNQSILHSQLAGTTSQPSRPSSHLCSQAGRRVETPGRRNGDRPRVRAGTKRQPPAGETRATCGGTVSFGLVFHDTHHSRGQKRVSDRNRFCPRFRVFCLLSVKVCSWYKTHSKTGNLAGVRYVSILLVQGIQFSPVTVSFETFSGHKTMMYTLKVLNNFIRDRGSDCNCIITGSVELLVECILLSRCLLSKILFFIFVVTDADGETGVVVKLKACMDNGLIGSKKKKKFNVHQYRNGCRRVAVPLCASRVLYER